MKSTLQTINDLAEKSPKELVMRAERHYLNEISAAAERIAQNKSIKVIAIAGPSSSGKTTTAHMLREALAKQGIKTDVVSLDDFYLPQETLPLLPDGTRDIESVNALDIPLINKCFNEALMTGKAALPKFDFLKKIRIENAHELDISGNSIVIAEGLHALNPVLTEIIPQDRLFKVYISVNRSIEDENGKVLLTSRQIRLTRRILRDRIFRSTSLAETLKLWKGVTAGEEKYLYCFKNRADLMIKTLHIYEPCLYKSELSALKEETAQCADNPYFMKTLESIDHFCPIDSSLIPQNSLIREFIGTDSEL